MIAPVLSMVQKEAEPKPHIPDIEYELNETLRWAREWSSWMRNWWGLTPRELQSLRDRYIKDLTAPSVHLPDYATNEPKAYDLRVFRTHDKELGPVDLLELERVAQTPNQPKITKLFYQREDFSNLIGVSFQWDNPELNVVYERINFKYGKIRDLTRMVQLQTPFLHLIDQITLGFNYHETGKLMGWLGEVTALEERTGRKLYGGGSRQSQPFDPLPHIKTFGRNRSRALLIL